MLHFAINSEPAPKAILPDNCTGLPKMKTNNRRIQYEHGITNSTGY